jgi:hypothetical protein
MAYPDFLRQAKDLIWLSWKLCTNLTCVLKIQMTKSKLISGMSRTVLDSDLIATRFTLALVEFAWATMLLGIVILSEVN